MGLTLIRKSRDSGRRRDPHIALVLAGGAVSGGAFKVGGLKALNDFLVGRDITQLDSYVGLSAGAFLAVPLAIGIGPDEMVRVLNGSSDRFEQLRPIDFYSPNIDEYCSRPIKFLYDLVTYLPGVAADLAGEIPSLHRTVRPQLREFLRDPTYTRFEALLVRLLDQVSPSREIPALTNHIPSGMFHNRGLERWLRRNLEKVRMPNDFRAFQRKLGRNLYISACDLDTAERVIFGWDETCEVTISQAVQASTAVPGFYKPARINGVDYVDGGVRSTANIDIAIEKGADLIICYNPFRPFLNRVESEGDGSEYFAQGRYLADRGFKTVMNQVFRTLLHSRLKLGIQRYLADDRFQGDIVLLEPREQDASFFALNPLAFWKRDEAVRHGFRSVRETIELNYDALSGLLAGYGLEMSREQAASKAAAILGEPETGEGEDPQPALRLVGS